MAKKSKTQNLKNLRNHLFLFLLVFSTVASAQLKLAEVFTDNMVLQCEKPVKVWGRAAPNVSVAVKFAGQTVKGMSDAEGKFMLQLKPLKANSRPQVLTVSSRRERQMVRNVLVGEVWLCGGQSNMEFNMGPVWRGGSVNKVDKPAKGPDVMAEDLAYIRNAAGTVHPLVRSLLIEKTLDTDTLPTYGWKGVDARSIEPLSAVAYYFARHLSDSLNVPVGVIVSCWGGSDIQGWTGPNGARYQHMIQPMAPFTMRGFLWYQGESNLLRGQTKSYESLQTRLVENWRSTWNDQALPFYFVQLAPYNYSPRRGDPVPHTWDELARFRDVQDSLQQHVPLCGMAATIDLCDNLKDIHPTYKWEVSRRLALLALNKTFGRTDLVCTGPRCVDVNYEGNKAILTFDQPLTTNDGQAPRCFSLTDGRKFDQKPQEAIIRGNQVILTMASIKPTHVSYAYDEVAITNLCNKEGLPAWPFKR
ncbi:MAG: hypothetical protein IJT97_00505 [Bacteroidaceae bacterium]|nr:hypothetical protein [Bacteroidaceae bacterium]